MSGKNKTQKLKIAQSHCEISTLPCFVSFSLRLCTKRIGLRLSSEPVISLEANVFSLITSKLGQLISFCLTRYSLGT